VNNQQKTAVVLELLDKLQAHGSWCGETHLQKSVYLLQEVTRVPMEFNFRLYIHGPFSFDFHERLSEFRADGLIVVVVQPYPYGPSFASTKSSEVMRRRFPKTLKTYELATDFVAEAIGAKGVAELEQLSTAYLVTTQSPQRASAARRAVMLRKMKPHIDEGSAINAVNQCDELIERWKRFASPVTDCS